MTKTPYKSDCCYADVECKPDAPGIRTRWFVCTECESPCSPTKEDDKE